MCPFAWPENPRKQSNYLSFFWHFFVASTRNIYVILHPRPFTLSHIFSPSKKIFSEKALPSSCRHGHLHQMLTRGAVLCKCFFRFRGVRGRYCFGYLLVTHLMSFKLFFIWMILTLAAILENGSKMIENKLEKKC